MKFSGPDRWKRTTLQILTFMTASHLRPNFRLHLDKGNEETNSETSLFTYCLLTKISRS